MSSIFIASSSSDREFVEQLKPALIARSHTIVSWQETALLSGRSIHSEIMRTLVDIDALVIIWSKKSARHAGMRFEFETAMTYQRQRGRPVVIPVVLDRDAVPSDMSSLVYIDATDTPVPEVAEAIDSVLAAHLASYRARVDEKREQQQHVEATAAEFIQPALHDLKQREVSYRRWAYFWYGIAYFTLVMTTLFAGLRVSRVAARPLAWTELAELAVASLLLVVMLIALAKYAFTLGKSYMVESLRNADRRHAISFGEFYLKAFASQATWIEVKEAFQHWNIDRGSHFLSQETRDFDPRVVESVAELLLAAAKNERKTS
jgi:hypothetical protein